ALAKQIARSIRESSGGLPAVQALGMATDDPNIMQVSMNLLDTSVTPLLTVFETVREQASAAGVDVIESEVVGLLPMDVLVATTRTQIKAKALEAEQVIEARLLQALGSAEAPPAN
ncbi:MAG: glutamate formiminotransferase, partial [Chloroflexota bacterium]